MKKDNSALSIKRIVLKNLMESKEPFFYLAPDIVGSVNNAYPDKQRKRFVIDFNTVDDSNMKLMVPYKTYTDWHGSNSNNSDNMILNFLTTFLQGSKPCGEEGGDEMLGEMVDEFGDIYSDTEDKPANVKGSPGYYNQKSSASALPQYTAQFTKIISPLGYGGVVW